MKSRLFINNLFKIVFLPASLNTIVFAQKNASSRTLPEDDNFWWYYPVLAVLGLALAAAVVIWYKKKNKTENTFDKKSKAIKKEADGEMLSFDADAEMEWLRKHQNVVDRKRKKPRMNANLPEKRVFADNQTEAEDDIPTPLSIELLDATTLPVFKFERIEPATSFDSLSISNDGALLNAVEQSQEEDEEDEEVRELSLRILTAFRTRNSVEALSQIAIYDLSSTLRSKAVSTLAEFDHESVFEAILLACADPTREVRAAAARALSRLSFDRADAWTRILETNEQGRIRQSARAAIEGGFVERSFDRLVHRDTKLAYEAFVMLALLIKSGEHAQIFEALKNHQDIKVRRAIVHVLKVIRDDNSMSILYNLLEDKNLSGELKESVDNAVEEITLITA